MKTLKFLTNAHRKAWRRGGNRGSHNSKATTTTTTITITITTIITVMRTLAADSDIGIHSDSDINIHRDIDIDYVDTSSVSSRTLSGVHSYTEPDEAKELDADYIQLRNDCFVVPRITGSYSDKSGVAYHNFNQKDDNNLVEVVDAEQEGGDLEDILQDDMREDSHLAHWPRHYLNSTVNILDPPKPSTFAEVHQISGSQSSRLLHLPLELQQIIYSQLDVTSLIYFALVSKVARSIVETIPAWRNLSDHGPGMLATMSQMKLLRRHTISQLYETLCSALCVGCPPSTYGAYVFLPTAHRCCWVCLSYHPMFRVISLKKAAKTFGVSIQRIKREIQVFQSIPGVYDGGWQIAISPHRLVCAKEMADLGLKVHGSVDRLKVAVDVPSWNESPIYKREATYLHSMMNATLGEDDPWSWAPPTRSSSWPRPSEEFAVFDWNFGKAAMLVSRFRPGVGVEHGLWCRGCDLVLEDYENQRLLDEYISRTIENERKELGISRVTGHLGLGDIVRGLTKQARSPAELIAHAKYCHGAQKLLWEAGSSIRLFISDSSEQGSRCFLDLSTIVDSGGYTTYIVNGSSLLDQSSLQSENSDDYNVPGGRRDRVVYRGKRIMEGTLNGQLDFQNQDLVRENVAYYVPGFDANMRVISTAILKRDLSYWVCGYNDTLRAGTYNDPKVLLQLLEISNVSVAEYEEDPKQITFPVRQTSSADLGTNGLSVVTGPHIEDEQPKPDDTDIMGEIGWFLEDEEISSSQQDPDAQGQISQTWESDDEILPSTPPQEASCDETQVGRESSNVDTSNSVKIQALFPMRRRSIPPSVFARGKIEKNSPVLGGERLVDPDTISDHQSFMPPQEPLPSPLPSPLPPESQSRTEFIPEKSSKIIFYLPALYRAPSLRQCDLPNRRLS